MKVTDTKLSEVKIIEPECFGDQRGWFMETYNVDKYKDIGISTLFVQDNHSMSEKKGTFRGLHYQDNPMAQSKLVRCTKGVVLDFAVDIRKGSPTFKQWVYVELSAENKKQFFIPRGFAHGFLCLSDDVEFEYKVDNFYSKEYDRSIFYNDPSIGIMWSEFSDGLDLILSEKDKNSPLLDDCGCSFVF